MIWFILILLGVGLVIGALARLLVPGTDSMSLGGVFNKPGTPATPYHDAG